MVTELETPRLILRPLTPSDFPEWSSVRVGSGEWLTRWEPRRPEGSPDPSRDPRAFAARCAAREREARMGTGHSFGLFVRKPRSRFVGMINISNIQRGPFQSGTVGYWIDEVWAGRGLVPEGLVAVLGFAFEDLELHRIEIGIIPINRSSRRVVEKLGIREEGVALRMLKINGRWEDHVRYAITAEEWELRKGDLRARVG